MPQILDFKADEIPELTPEPLPESQPIVEEHPLPLAQIESEDTPLPEPNVSTIIMKQQSFGSSEADDVSAAYAELDARNVSIAQSDPMETERVRVEEAIRIRNRNPDDFFSSKYWPQVPGPDKYVNQEGVLMMFITEFHNKRMVT